MSQDFAYDPVTATDEATATGEVAAIFADIRETMAIPLVTSIWRGLADMGTALRDVWGIVKPVYQSGAPAPALARVLAGSGLPAPDPLGPGQLSGIGIGPDELAASRAVLRAYNRSNGLNFVALAALLMPPAGSPVDRESVLERPTWPVLRPLLPRQAIGNEAWALVKAANAVGAPGPDAFVATLWRHLAHWPALLALIHSALGPLQASGDIASACSRAVTLARGEGARLASLRPAAFSIPQPALDTIRDYVMVPTHVARMVVIGHILDDWLARGIR